ncbi:LysE family translocator [Salinarimonas rosea]|uniref:LysE family translocator n=1 Tax=Salinarimonas rosea TaxID=552063 RepID=UPI0004145C96|nr:LysE family translocator [Salinarimonas rosea]
MDLAALLAFAAILFVAAAAPGPGIAAIVARVLGRGTDGAVAFTIGLAIGDVVWLTCAIFGLAALAQSFHGVFVAVKLIGAAYLLYLAWKLWTAPVVAREITAQAPKEGVARLFLAGLAVTLGNPKTMVFYLALLPTVLDVASVTALGYAELVGVTLAVLGVVFAGYIVLAARARRLFTSPRAMRVLNRVTGTVMAGAAVTVATR